MIEAIIYSLAGFYLLGCATTAGLALIGHSFSCWVLKNVVRGSKQSEVKILSCKLKVRSRDSLRRCYLWPLWVIVSIKILFEKENLIDQ